MITITPNLDQLKRAKTLYDFGILDNSITQGDGSAAGAIAEICFFDYFKEIGKEIIHAKHHDYDFILTDKKIEVKAMRVNTIPKLMHHCNLSSHNLRQKCDYYCFISVMNDFTKVFINGYISKKDFFDNAVLHLEGETENNFTYKCDTMTMTISQLKQLNHE